ncbi:MAG: hypothetical protein D3920_08200, partial [Candidatus Electrothrix sp. AW2]|nr:hypothetical protein [Candidatus Electrothrix gigas]
MMINQKKVPGPRLTSQYTICPGCDLLLEKVQPTSTHTPVCPRCSHRLQKQRPDAVQRTLVLS